MSQPSSDPTLSRDTDPARPPPAERGPWRVFVFLTPIAVVLVAVAAIVGYAYGQPAGEEYVQEDVAQRSRDGVRTPVPRPTTIAPEPFVSSMPRPKLTALKTDMPPATLVGSPYEPTGPTTTMHPNLPFSFRVPEGTWQVDTPFPEQDIAYADVYLRPTGTETPATAPLRAAFAWRACGQGGGKALCSTGKVKQFDELFRTYHETPDYALSRTDSRTSYTEVTGTAMYYIIVQRLFDGSDGRTYLVDYLTQAPIADKEQAQQLANEILTQMS